MSFTLEVLLGGKHRHPDRRTSYTPQSSRKISSHFQTFQNLFDYEKEDTVEVLFIKSGPALEIAKSVGDCSTPLWEMQAKRIRSIFPFTIARLSSILGCASIRWHKSPIPLLIEVWNSQDVEGIGRTRRELGRDQKLLPCGTSRF